MRKRIGTGAGVWRNKKEREKQTDRLTTVIGREREGARTRCRERVTAAAAVVAVSFGGKKERF